MSIFEGTFSLLLFGGTKEFGVIQWIPKFWRKKTTWWVPFNGFNFLLLVNEFLVHLLLEIYEYVEIVQDST